MNRTSYVLAGLALLGAMQGAFAASVAIDRATLKRLASTKPDEQQTIAQFPVGGSTIAPVRLHAEQIYADDAKVIVISAQGRQELPRSRRIFLQGATDDGATRIALSLNTDGTFADGAGSAPDGSFVLTGKTDANGSLTLTAQSVESALPPGFNFDFRCGNEDIALTSSASIDVASQLQRATHASPNLPAASAATLRYATVAIDTDSLFMSRLFSNNTTTATNWIASNFNLMNTMYEPNLQVHLLVGTTILRTSSSNDPYTGFSTGSADSTKLNFFGNYWKTNEAAVSRSFATLFSGVIASTSNGCSASGIAWIDAYCNKGQTQGTQTFGSYSVNEVCTNLAIDNNTGLNARVIGHELGHNFGADHTHCTDATSGASVVSSNTVDQCFNGESSRGCYGGTQVCPAGGKGTIMSYCNVGACSGTQNLLQFANVQISKVLLPDIAANTPSCLSTTVDEIFANGFE